MVRGGSREAVQLMRRGFRRFIVRPSEARPEKTSN
ncbi:hypothetical protein SBADM41S_09013 [Streptomyces badius]